MMMMITTAMLQAHILPLRKRKVTRDCLAPGTTSSEDNPIYRPATIVRLNNTLPINWLTYHYKVAWCRAATWEEDWVPSPPRLGWTDPSRNLVNHRPHRSLRPPPAAVAGPADRATCTFSISWPSGSGASCYRSPGRHPRNLQVPDTYIRRPGASVAAVVRHSRLPRHRFATKGNEECGIGKSCIRLEQL